MAKIDFTNGQIEIILWALDQCIYGDNDPYDKKIKRIIKKIKEQTK